MAQTVTLAQAARLLGISRQQLQELARRGDLHTFEGGVDLDELRQRFPVLAMNERATLERLAYIKETAFSRRVRETVLPRSEALELQARRNAIELAVQTQRSERLCAVISDLVEYLGELQQHSSGSEKALLQELNVWLLKRLEE